MTSTTTMTMTAPGRDARDRLPRTCAAADTVLWFAAVDSTNTVAHRMLADGTWPAGGANRAGAARRDGTAARGGAAAPPAPPMAVVVADEQTAGRGRLGRQWVSRPGESSMVSYATVLPARIATDPQVNGWLQMTAGLATLDALRGACRDAGAAVLHGGPCGMALKWPNDVFCHDHKLGGILAELVALPPAAGGPDAPGWSPGGAFDGPPIGVVFGVGLNLGIPADRLPTPLSTSLQLHRGPLPEPDAMRDMIAARTAASLRARLVAFIADPREAARRAHEETRAVCWTLGRRVEARLAEGGTVRGEALELNPDASLTVLADDGARHIVHTGDVGVL
ncbi:biotin--[acetyl-CoA-carboxylase] ligase [Bifidobacterium phasiani]|nr:biotin--[acetyl-CoA-carboxylase] ligase [Bifidobacterium phasiani]